MTLDYKNTYLLLGSNLGDRELLLEKAIKLIDQKIGKIFAKSSIYETAAWGKTDQPNFLNLALGVETTLSPLELLNTLLVIEEKLGRMRDVKWGARLIDIDIIFYSNEVVDLGEKLKIPHLEMQNRRFVLKPLAEISPNFIHPILKKTILELLENLNDGLDVRRR